MNKHTYFILTPKAQFVYTSQYYKSLIQESLYLIQRLLIQTIRRPSSLISGMIQPFLWLILFGGLFQNAPIGLFTQDITYGIFLSCGIIAFTSFTGALNAGLPLIFDREFGFLNRLLVSPLVSRDTILISLSLFIISITTVQTIIVFICSINIFDYTININQSYICLMITLLVTSSISNISLTLALVLPGHIEFLALTLLLNLPILFSSTALAPLYFMPYWLQILTNFNPLTYAIESLRFILTTQKWQYSSKILETLWIHLSLSQTIFFLSILSIISFFTLQKIMLNKIE